MERLTSTHLLIGRKVGTATPSIKVPARSASPTVATPATASGHQRSRLSRQIHPPVQDEDDDMDGEVDEEGDGDDGDGDDRLYCYCQSQSYGDVRSSSLVPCQYPH